MNGKLTKYTGTHTCSESDYVYIKIYNIMIKIVLCLLEVICKATYYWKWQELTK